MLNIAVLVSGGGTNLQALIDAEKSGKILNGRIAAVISSRENAYAVERARKSNLPCYIVSNKDFSSQQAFDEELLRVLRQSKTDLIVLAGFLSILSKKITGEYENRIINVHPSLIPAFCGSGYYGLKVHEAALKYGVKVTGATVHFVNEVPDGGAIIFQKAVEVLEGDTPQTLQQRVMRQAEWILLPRAVSMYCQGKIRVENGKVSVLSETD